MSIIQFKTGGGVEIERERSRLSRATFSGTKTVGEKHFSEFCLSGGRPGSQPDVLAATARRPDLCIYMMSVGACVGRERKKCGQGSAKVVRSSILEITACSCGSSET